MGRATEKSHDDQNDDGTAALQAAEPMERWHPEKVRAALRVFMAQRNLTIPDWTRAADIADSTLRNFLDGASDSLHMRTAMRLAGAARATVSEMIGEPQPRPQAQPSRLDTTLLAAIVSAIEGYLAERNELMEPDAKARAIAIVYDIAESATRDGPFALTGTYENVIRLALRRPT